MRLGWDSVARKKDVEGMDNKITKLMSNSGLWVLSFSSSFFFFLTSDVAQEWLVACEKNYGASALRQHHVLKN